MQSRLAARRLGTPPPVSFTGSLTSRSISGTTPVTGPRLFRFLTWLTIKDS
jgi:hypothetical protein